jgi:ribosome-associated protein
MRIELDPADCTWTAVRSQGAGGQNVNKVATGIHLRFDIRASSLPEPVKSRLLASGDRRVTTDGEVVIKAQRHRTQERNLADAYERLQALIDDAARIATPRRPTRPTAGSRRRRVDDKVRRGQVKAARKRPAE